MIINLLHVKISKTFYLKICISKKYQKEGWHCFTLLRLALMYAW